MSRKIEVVDRILSWSNTSLWTTYVDYKNIPLGWNEFFRLESVQTSLSEISDELEAKSELCIYPEITSVFRAFYLTPLENVKAVLVGMDPYHNGNATGLCFEVPTGAFINPSLQMIYRELGSADGADGDLSHWARAGVLMWNVALTVEAGNPGSHAKLWSAFSERLVRYLSKVKPDIHWILLGKHAHQVKNWIDPNANVEHIHLASHPMPLAASPILNRTNRIYCNKIDL